MPWHSRFGLTIYCVLFQWFGNIVTMKWWTDLWLNEGFATYVSAVGVDHIHPDWKMVSSWAKRANKLLMAFM